METIDDILDDLNITDRDVAIYYLFHLCKSPDLLAYKNFFHREPSTLVSALVNVDLLFDSDVEEPILRRYNKMCANNPKQFLSIIKAEIDDQNSRLIPSCLNSNVADKQSQKNHAEIKHAGIADESLQYYSTIENGVLIKFDERDLDSCGCFVTPDSVKVIGEFAFEYCTNLKHIVISNGVTQINDGAFACCLNLETIQLPTSLKTIGDISFLLCKNLKSLTIPPKVTKLGYMAFSACLKLEEAVLHNNVTNIDSSAFYLTDTTPINLPSKFIQDWNDGKFNRGLSRSFSGILDAIRERNGFEPLNLVSKY